MIGILGGGQLGRMLALAGVPLGMSFRVLDPSSSAPAGVAAEHVPAEFEDIAALDAFANGLDVVTYEFENVPVESVEYLERRLPVYPSSAALRATQDRLVEKSLFRDLGIQTPSFHAVDDWESLNAAVGAVGLPAVLKTRRFGYDGKGQFVLKGPEDLRPALDALAGHPLILEAFVPFDRELSIIAVRGRDGQTRHYPLVENHHGGGILRMSRAPAPNVTPALESAARSIVDRLLDRLDYVGVLTVELFEVSGELQANEFAPRVHNSGHWTIEGAQTSQFENHLRAISNLPLGSTEPLGPSTMLNLIGGWPQPADVLSVPDAHLHLYGKDPRPGRKVGHVTIRHHSGDGAAEVDLIRRWVEQSTAD